MARIGFIGLGTMGGPMAQNLLRGGHSVAGFDMSPAVMERHGEAGGVLASSPREAAEGANIVITMLPDGPDVERAVLGDDGALGGLGEGAILIDMSTIDPAVTRRIGAEVAARGAFMIDSPVGKTADHAVAGTLTLMVGGDREIVDRVRPILNLMGQDFFYCGPLGMGEAMKLTNNFLAATIMAASVEALVLGTKAGLSLGLMMDVMRTTMAWNNQLAIALPRKALADDFSLGFMVRLAQKDQRLAVAMADALGVETPVGLAAHDTLAQAAEQGFAEDDVGSILRLRERQAGVRVRSTAQG
jgi:4-hydroxybutyrate dehydrogenase / sulfolactaldehyde 3-reductase